MCLRRDFFPFLFAKPGYLENNSGIFHSSGTLTPTPTPSFPLLWLFPHTALINKSNIYQRRQASLRACPMVLGGGCDNLQEGCISGRLEVISATMTNSHCTHSMCQACCAKCLIWSFSPWQTPTSRCCHHSPFID